MSYSIAQLVQQAEELKAAMSASAPQPELPEFAFSPAGERVPMPAGYRSGIAPHEGPMAPAKPRAKGEKRTVSPAEEGWLNMRTLFDTPVREHSRPPVGTAPTLEGLGHFLARVDEINAIAATQAMELPTVGQELAQTGISSFSISSSFDDESDDASAEVSDADLERNACRYGTAYVAAELAPLVRRIEWEQFIYRCGPAQRVTLTVVDGRISAMSESKTLAPEEVAAWGKRIWLAMGKPDADTLANSIAYARHYGVIGSAMYGVKKGDHTPEQTFDALGAEDMEELTQDGGPSELGLHNVEQGTVLYEPTAAELWPDDYADFNEVE